MNKAKNNKFSALFIREGDIILEALLDCLLLLSWCGFKAVSASLCLCTSSVSSLQIQVIMHSDSTNPIIASTELCYFHHRGVYNFSFSQKDFSLKSNSSSNHCSSAFLLISVNTSYADPPACQMLRLLRTAEL